MKASHDGNLNAVNLKQALWETLERVRSGELSTSQGDVIASQAREILRTVKVQLQVFQQAGRAVSSEIIDFAKPDAT